MPTPFKSIALWALLIVSTLLKGQTSTDIELQNRYWTYRENLRKYFTSIGPLAGQGLPFSDIEVQTFARNVKINSTGDDIWGTEGNQDVMGRLNVGGDVTAYMAEYMGVLASEYWLLQNQHMGTSDEMKAVKNEIYFAINAIERLDKYSKSFFEKTQTNEVDGFFVRDDEEQTIIKYFDLCSYPQIKFMTGLNTQGRELDLDKSDKLNNKFISWLPTNNAANPKDFFRFNDFDDILVSKYHDAETWDPESKLLGEMSQDQLIHVLFGFKCIVKFVEDYVVVDPDGPGSLPEKNIQLWVKDLTDKMMLRLSANSYKVPMYSYEEIKSKRQTECEEKNKYKWVPSKNGVPTNSGVRFDTYSRCKDDYEECTSDPCNNWQTDTKKPWNPNIIARSNYVITNPHFGNIGVSRGPYAFYFGYPLEKLGEDIARHDYNAVSVELSAGTAAAQFLTILPGDISVKELGRPFDPQNPDYWRDYYNYLPKKKKVRKKLAEATGASMYLWLSAAAGVWTHQQYFDIMDELNREIADIFWVVLNDNKDQPKISANDIEYSLLNSNCEIIQNAKDEGTEAPFNKVSYFSKLASNGNDNKDHYIDNGINGSGVKIMFIYLMVWTGC